MALSTEPAAIGRHHRLLADFRRAFREGPLEGGPLAIEGPRLLAEAIRSSQRLEMILFSKTGLDQLGARLLPQFSKHVETAVVDDAAFATAMESEHPQGVAALIRFSPASLDDVFGPAATAPPLVLAAAGLQDPGNLGTLIRAADAFGASGVVALADSASPFNAKSVRAGAGSHFHLPIAARIPASAFITACRQRGLRLVAADARGKLAPSAAALAGPAAILIGQEAAGIPRELARAADETVAIPFARPVDSLNAAVAGAILLYEAAQQRRAGSGNLEMP
ncbi:MAG TPA: RNA methyltransferase [Terriglobales bacterium]|nr:RNA methyltransferase [Terriglobales bacterium]